MGGYVCQKTNDNKQMRNASYTACDVCQGKSPLWQIDARKVSYDAAGQNINYNDAVLRVKNIPVFYTPFLSHPSPEVKRRSGLLMTSMGSTSYTGQYIQPTYFWNVSDHTDVICRRILRLTAAWCSEDSIASIFITVKSKPRELILKTTAKTITTSIIRRLIVPNAAAICFGCAL